MMVRNQVILFSHITKRKERVVVCACVGIRHKRRKKVLREEVAAGMEADRGSEATECLKKRKLNGQLLNCGPCRVNYLAGFSSVGWKEIDLS